jgi:hypothetical protein
MPQFIKRKNKINGPFSTAQITNAINSGKIREDDEISSSETGPWLKIADWSFSNSMEHTAKEDAVEDWLGISNVATSQKKKQDPELVQSSPVPPATKRCPFCAESIAIAAKKCKHCGEHLDQIDSQRRPPVSSWPRRLALAGGIITFIAVFIFVIDSLQTAHIDSLEKKNAEIIERVRNGTERAEDLELLRKNAIACGDSMGRNDRLGETVGAAGVAGAVVGGVIGSVVPGLGTVVGAGGGAVVGSGLGYVLNQLIGKPQSYIDASVLATESSYRAAKG